MLKSKYSIDEQLKNLEDKNVQFNIMSKEEAREYLQNNTYYFKLKSYEKSFEYNVSKNQYINLEFAYLVELSKLDMYLRELIIRISLHTEHFLKVKLIDDLTKSYFTFLDSTITLCELFIPAPAPSHLNTYWLRESALSWSVRFLLHLLSGYQILYPFQNSSYV